MGQKWDSRARKARNDGTNGVLEGVEAGVLMDGQG